MPARRALPRPLHLRQHPVRQRRPRTGPQHLRALRRPARPPGVCALLDRHGAPLSDRLEILLDAGMPIAVWRRTSTGSDSGTRTESGTRTDTDRGADGTGGADGTDGALGPGCGGCRARTADGLAAVLAAAGATGEFDLGRLPAAVRQVRIGGPPGGCGGCPGGEPLGLLWDDPEHRPQTRSLS
ncbi:hypothetical protein ACFVVX_23815 [Kitasatospora sp. NPDC058170]|uniref:VMAP-C domain-containing protein n=1 Tax=Kitasatospora sp. NPDC058170 TaxID=3346364 RepID=UPI0036DDF5E7